MNLTMRGRGRGFSQALLGGAAWVEAHEKVVARAVVEGLMLAHAARQQLLVLIIDSPDHTVAVEYRHAAGFRNLAHFCDGALGRTCVYYVSGGCIDGRGWWPHTGSMYQLQSVEHFRGCACEVAECTCENGRLNWRSLRDRVIGYNAKLCCRDAARNFKIAEKYLHLMLRKRLCKMLRAVGVVVEALLAGAYVVESSSRGKLRLRTAATIYHHQPRPPLSRSISLFLHSHTHLCPATLHDHLYNHLHDHLHERPRKNHLAVHTH